MSDLNVFVSVGGTANETQEGFVRAVEDRLRSEGMIPHTVGRNTFSADSPLKTVEQLMDRCAGTVVLALERTYFESGYEKRGGKNVRPLEHIKLPTPWNHIEAAMSYTRGLPLLVVVENGLNNEGLLEHGYDWYVQKVALDTASLSSPEFNGVLASWKQKMIEGSKKCDKQPERDRKLDPNEFTVGQLVTGLKPAQLWSLLGSAAVVVAGAFALGANLVGK